MPANLTIAIDGPGAVGKTTVGRLLAKRLGFMFIDTGKMYRALTLVAIQEGIDATDGESLERLARRISIEFVKPLSLDATEGERVFVDGQDATKELKQPEVDRRVSLVSKHLGVREAMVEQQRRLGARGRVVMAGRDIGTVVLPDAGLKVYLTATAEERARRRHRELSSLGYCDEFSSIMTDLGRRDKIDSEREVAPLRQDTDAHLVDTTDMTPEGVVELIVGLWEREADEDSAAVK